MVDGKLVIRPDSGDPVQTLKRILSILWEKFGGHVNTKGFKVLHPNIRLIQGDGIDRKSLPEILDAIIANIPIGRLGRPQEIADAVAFFASPDSGFMTGANLDINGGQYM